MCQRRRGLSCFPVDHAERHPADITVQLRPRRTPGKRQQLPHVHEDRLISSIPPRPARPFALARHTLGRVHVIDRFWGDHISSKRREDRMMAVVTTRKRLLMGAVVVLLGAGLCSPLPAHAISKWSRRQAKRGSCSPPQSLVRLDRKTCPATKFRPPLVVTRACCENRGGRRHCKPYPNCPAHSPS